MKRPAQQKMTSTLTETHLADYIRPKHTHTSPHFLSEHVCITILAMPFLRLGSMTISHSGPCPPFADLLILCLWHKLPANFAGLYPDPSVHELSFLFSLCLKTNL
ncbi:hypothetical protein CHARACLAT_016885 [Characodon lateralis]|uniref:Uncharacterized protein n=1 Tax=Characodon lateralis TaxID=208331 RepID=A0ABU7E1P9_9TELE|nr:hypothetical protein [Characodon lateralis]